MGNSWPQDSDGDVLRMLEEMGVDFNEEQNIDFNVDIESWPPSEKLIELLEKSYSNVELYEPEEIEGEEEDLGYVLVVVRAKLTYELVVAVQKSLTELAAPFGGNCEAWGVLN